MNLIGQQILDSNYYALLMANNVFLKYVLKRLRDADVCASYFIFVAYISRCRRVFVQCNEERQDISGIESQNKILSS